MDPCLRRDPKCTAGSLRLYSLLFRRSAPFLALEMRDHLLAEQAVGVEHLLMRRRAYRTEKSHLLDPHRLVQLDKADALIGRADAELGALLAHLLGRRLARVRGGGEGLGGRVIALVVGRYGRRVVIAPHQAGALALLLDIPADKLGAALGNDFAVL